MSGWTQHRGMAVGLPREGIDTDQLIPARFMSAPRSAGYGDFLLHDLRHDENGQTLPDFPLNAPSAKGASILVARRNFGGGSSREAAVYALVDAGFRVVVAPSFGDIFAGNAVNNGMLPARISEANVERLLAKTPAELSVDLSRSVIEGCGEPISFDLDPIWRMKIENGWDDIELTRSYHDRIAAFAHARRDASPWIWGS
ncbi:3-isopropylmalate dehydratase small subunit [Rhizobium sp. EC-SD404]|uniref:3-isopropylmalate dehydratase small subunit n=1 Tax=Rhizobium sp. EC-SD404 TaxID=2038389 RepID=UPI0012521ABF|nr:3-isopropylmalate dehydratase small subunit [Rhizobium sp. EC-SD404]VVT26828.1 3-isopropylmalate isomerase subunit [Rhizobium sp. EC-SD404]